MQTLRMRNASNSKGFTLIELLIVILIIGLIYGLFVSNLHDKKEETQNITLLNMKQTLLLQPFKKKSEIVCFEPCEECFIYNDGKKSDAAPFSLFKTAPKVYKKDQFAQLQPYTFLAFLDDEEKPQNVCFRFSVFNNKSSSHYLVETQKKFYLFHPYLKEVEVASTLSDAKKLLDLHEILPRENRDYDF